MARAVMWPPKPNRSPQERQMLDKTTAERPATTEVLADEMAALEYSDLPSPVIAKVKELLLDSLGNIISGSLEQPAQILARVLTRQGGEGEASAVATDKMLPAVHAGFINGVSAHSVEMDDAHHGALTKTGSVIIPAAMAMGEATAADGKKFIAAIVAGYETMIRIGLAVNPGHRTRGYHSTGTVGVFGAAATAGKLLGFDGRKLANAFGVAGTQASGLMAFQNYPSMIKQLNVGKAVYNGLLSAQLVREGFTGPINILESPEGFGRAFTDELHLEELTRGLGRDYRILEVGYKPHAACRWAHAAIDAVAEIVQRTGVKAADVDHIDIYAATLGVRQTSERQPKSLMDARGFSTPFGVAAAFVLGRTRVSVHDFKTAWSNPKVMELSKRIVMHEDPQFGTAGIGSRVEIVRKSGERLTATVTHPKGEPENPITPRELQDKWHMLVDPVIGERRAKEISEIVAACERLPIIDVLTAILPSTARQIA
jgi:2-methylcitrate dehydratase PrpD